MEKIEWAVLEWLGCYVQVLLYLGWAGKSA